MKAFVVLRWLQQLVQHGLISIADVGSLFQLQSCNSEKYVPYKIERKLRVIDPAAGPIHEATKRGLGARLLERYISSLLAFSCVH
jgi:hypothetical protein